MYPILIHGEAAFSQLEEDWDLLVSRSMTNTPFQRLGYQQSWWRNLGSGHLFSIAICDSSDQLAAIFCGNIRDGIVTFNGGVEETDYLDIIAAGNVAEEAWALVFDVLATSDVPYWTSVDLNCIPLASSTLRIVSGLAASQGYRVEATIQDVCPTIQLLSTFDGYLSQLSKKHRHEIRRKLRRAHESGARFIVVNEDDGIEQAVEDFLRLLQLSGPAKDRWLNGGRRQLFLDVARLALSAGFLQLLFLEVEGRNIAGLFNFDYEGCFCVYNSGIDMQFDHLSPGVVLTSLAIDQAIARGSTAFDFLRGNEEYKYRFGAQDKSIYRMHIERLIHD